MKKFLAFIIILAIIVGAIVLWVRHQEKVAQEKEWEEKRKQELARMEEKQEAEERRYQQWIQQQRAERAKLATEPKNQPAPPPVKPRQSGSHRDEVQKACREAGCRLVSYRESGGKSHIVVEGPTHNTVSDLLDPLIRMGMKDFSQDKDKYGVRREGTKRTYTAAYTLEW
mgnify:CR=1 FL=1